MPFADAIREATRQSNTGDDWYIEEYPYVLELRGAGVLGTGGPGFAGLTLPLTPAEMEVKRVYRQSVTPTMGGIIAEESGILWLEIRVRGTFGLAPKQTDDTTAIPLPPRGATPLSGPAWTQRMLRNIFDRYGKLKQQPRFGAFVQLIWHDLRLDEHWIVVPSDVATTRNTQRRFQYPYEFALKAISPANLKQALGQLSSLTGFAEAAQAVETVSREVQKVSAALTEFTAIAGQLRYYEQAVDQVVAGLGRVKNAAEQFINAETATVLIGRNELISTADTIQRSMDMLESQSEVPPAIRQRFAEGLDGLYGIAAQAPAFAGTYDQLLSTVQSTEEGAASDSDAVLDNASSRGAPANLQEAARRRERTDDATLVEYLATNRARTIGDYTSSKEYAVRAIDTLASIAAAELGDGGLWYDIAALNGLKAPYITPAGSPGTVKPGDIIAIPSFGPSVSLSTATAAQDQTSLLGTDLDIEIDPNSFPGRPVVDLRIDPRTNRDFAIASGLTNFVNGIQLRLWTQQGTMPLIPDYGLPRQIGLKNTSAALSLLRLAVSQALERDTRTDRIGPIRFGVTNDAVEINVDLVPIGSESSQTLTLTLV